MDVEQFASDSSSPVQLRKVMAGVAVVNSSCVAVKLTVPTYHQGGTLGECGMNSDNVKPTSTAHIKAILLKYVCRSDYFDNFK